MISRLTVVAPDRSLVDCIERGNGLAGRLYLAAIAQQVATDPGHPHFGCSSVISWVDEGAPIDVDIAGDVRLSDDREQLYRVDFRIRGQACSPVRCGARRSRVEREVRALFPRDRLSGMRLTPIDGAGVAVGATIAAAAVPGRGYATPF